MTKRSIHQEDITIINIYTNNRSQKYMKETLAELKREIDSFTIIVINLNTPHLIIDGTTRRKISKEIEELNNTINQLDVTYMQNTPSNNSRIHILLKCT